MTLKAILIVIAFAATVTGDVTSEEAAAIEYLAKLETSYSEACYKQTEIRWTYATNVTKETENKSVDASNTFAQFQANIQLKLLKLFPNLDNFKNDTIKRQIKYLQVSGPGTMPSEEVSKMNALQASMESTYATATVCKYRNPTICNYTLDPEIEAKLAKSKDYDELAYYWTAWHDTMGSKVTAAQYSEFVDLQNKMAKSNGFNDMSELWLTDYDNESPDWTARKFKAEMESIWKSLKPYYRKLHTYVGLELKKNPAYKAKMDAGKFGDNLPAHLFGNMWAQQWGELDETTKPFPDASATDVTTAMKKKGYTVKKIFEVADAFFADMGLKRMTSTFWQKSMLTKPKDRDVVCHASAEDMCKGKGNTDFRIKMCTKVTLDDLVTAHHEMGHIEYFMQYTNQPFIFRDGANPGFHEAIGDALALSVTTPKHLQCVLDLDLRLDLNCSHPKKTKPPAPPPPPSPIDINFLYLMALDKIAFLPFAYSVDKWRWEAFEGKITVEEYNDRWWELRKQNQRIVPPVSRNYGTFDPAAKYHIVANVEYMRYFISHILQFQFYEAMCIAAKEYTPGSPTSKPLYQCDFAGNKKAGKKLADMMALGFREPWPAALKVLTGSTTLNTSSLINYFTPLFDELDKRLDVAKVNPE